MTIYTITWAICGSTDIEAESREEAELKLAQIPNAVLAEDEALDVLDCTTEASRAADVRDEFHWNDVSRIKEVVERFMSASFEGVRPAKDAG